MIVEVRLRKTEWQFMEKDSIYCILKNTKTREERQGIIKNMTSNGKYIVEILEDNK